MTTNPRQRGWLRRARFDYAAALALCLLLYGVDMALKASASPGVAPPSWDWQVEASDLPALWDAWQALPAYASLRETAPASLQEIAVYVRKLTGVRPTPERLRFWLGHHLLLSGEGSDWVLSCRPGIALRIATLFQPALTEPADAGSESREFPYAWRGQFLLIASSQTFLNTVLSQGAPTQARDREPLSLTVAWTGPDAGELELRPTDGLPVILSPAWEPRGLRAVVAEARILAGHHGLAGLPRRKLRGARTPGGPCDGGVADSGRSGHSPGSACYGMVGILFVARFGPP
jgi:hypothetical protein